MSLVSIFGGALKYILRESVGVDVDKMKRDAEKRAEKLGTNYEQEFAFLVKDEIYKMQKKVNQMTLEKKEAQKVYYHDKIKSLSDEQLKKVLQLNDTSDLLKEMLLEEKNNRDI